MDALADFIQNDLGVGSLQAWIVAIALVAITGVLAHVVGKILDRVMQVDGSPIPASSILVNIVRCVIWIAGISFMLSACFKVDVDALLTALGIGGLAVSLGLQDTIKNLIGGLQITLMKIVRPGDHVIVNGIEGLVQDVSWRQTIVRDFEGSDHLIPNALMSSAEVTKVSPDTLVITKISFVNDGRDLDELVREMEQLAKRAIENIAELERDPWILMTEIGEYGMWGKLRFVLKDTTHAREARDAALRAIAPYTRLNPEAILLDNGEED